MAEKITFNTGAKNYEIVDQDGMSWEYSDLFLQMLES